MTEQPAEDLAGRIERIVDGMGPLPAEVKADIDRILAVLRPEH